MTWMGSDLAARTRARPLFCREAVRRTLLVTGAPGSTRRPAGTACLPAHRMISEKPPTDSTPFSVASLGLRVARTTRSVVGRRMQLEAIERELAAARHGLACVAIEGEPGIGKTRLLLAIEELARVQGFVPIGVTADEEIRGPFLLARSILACPSLHEGIAGTSAEAPVARAFAAAVASRDDDDLATLSADQRLVRVFDLIAVALRAVAAVRPLALLIDDLQWADEDSLRALRYTVRADATSPILLVCAIRPRFMRRGEVAMSDALASQSAAQPSR